MVKRIDVHIGHGKTGTSYLQTALALNRHALADQGIDYPVTDSEVERAERGVLTRGNFTHLDRLDDLNPRTDHLLLSSETLFHPFWAGSFGAELRERFPEAHINIFLFVRNPVENSASSYMQAVQKGLESKSFQDYLPSFNRPDEVNKAMDMCDYHKFSLKVANFSRRRNGILNLLAGWVGCTSLQAPEARVVNRTLTVAEAKLLTELNSRLPVGSTNRLGSILCAKLPHIKADKPKVSSEAMSEFRRRMRDQIDRVNNRVGSILYDLDSGDNFVTDSLQREYSFSDRQIRLIAAIVSENWKILPDKEGK